MATGPAKAVREKRETTVIEHMESENRHQFDVTLGTFDHPRYELIATGDVHDGAARWPPTSRRPAPRSRISATS